jgi:hypothetical protein
MSHCYDFEVEQAFSLYGKLLDELLDAHGTQEEDRCRMRVHAAFVAYMTVKEKMDAYSVRVPGAH